MKVHGLLNTAVDKVKTLEAITDSIKAIIADTGVSDAEKLVAIEAEVEKYKK